MKKSGEIKEKHKKIGFSSKRQLWYDANHIRSWSKTDSIQKEQRLTAVTNHQSKMVE